MATEKQPVPSAATQGGTSQSLASASKSTVKTASGTAIIATGAAVPLNDRQVAILEGRGVDLELAVRMGWRSAGQPGTGETIEIPYFLGGKEVNHKSRSLAGEKRFWQVEGGEKCLYNVDILATVADATLVITEGEMDCMIALQCGYNAVSVPDGAPKEKIGDKATVKYDYLAAIPKHLKRIIIAADGDNPGLNLLHDLGIRLGNHRCLWVKYPEGCKDLNDVFLALGSDGVKSVLDSAQFVKIDGLCLLSELPPLPTHKAMDIGIDALARHFRLRQGDFSVFTGIPSHGKTSLSNQMAFNMAWKHGWHVCFASFEQNPQTEHRRSLRTLYNMKSEWDQNEKELAAADKFINENFSFIVPPDDLDENADLVWLLDRMVAAVTRYDARLIVIDPWNELDHQYDSRKETITQYVGRAIKTIKKFAKKYLVHVMVIAHPAKMQKKTDGSYPVPTAYDISDSAHWYNKAEQIVIVHRNSEHETLIRVAKSRYHQILGVPADVKMTFNIKNYQYETGKSGTADLWPE